MKITIFKLDSPLADASNWNVQIAEPMLFARALANSVTYYVSGKLTIDLVGIYNKLVYEDDFTKISIVNRDDVDRESHLIFWQGSPIVNKYGSIKNIEDFGGDVYKHYVRVDWHSVAQYLTISHNGPKYAIITDPKCPILETTAGGFTNMVLLTQAFNTENLINYFKSDECQRQFGGKAVSKFSKVHYLPLHLLPMLSKLEIQSVEKREAILSTQALSYMTKDRLMATSWIINSNKIKEVDVLSKNDEKSMNHLDFLQHSCSGTKFNFLGSKSYIDAMELLQNYEYSICPSNELYAKCGVIPNRIVEATMLGVKPLTKESSFSNCDKSIFNLDILHQMLIDVFANN